MSFSTSRSLAREFPDRLRSLSEKKSELGFIAMSLRKQARMKLTARQDGAGAQATRRANCSHQILATSFTFSSPNPLKYWATER